MSTTPPIITSQQLPGEPTWEQVMSPLAASDRWAELRDAATAHLIRDYEEAGIEDQGISSSDINHTVYAYAKFLWKDGVAPEVDDIIRFLGAW